MYIGSTGERGLHHLVWEIVDNSVDESLAGYCDRIVVTLRADGGVRVERQRPRHPDRHRTRPGASPRSTMALTMLHAGGKFGGGGYKVSGGLHGVGVSVVNALSHRARRRGQATAATAGGRPSASACPTARWSRSEPSRRGTGTTITFWAARGHLRDHDVLLRDDHQPDPRDTPSSTRASRSWSATSGPTADEMLEARPGRHRRRRGRPRPAPTRSAAASSGGRRAHFKYDRGLVDYVEHLNRRKDTGATRPSSRSRPSRLDENGMSLEVAMQWNTTLHRVGAHLRQHDQHPRGRHPRGGLPRRADRPWSTTGARSGA